jgi:betaine-aldehyde dehydrogenase
MSDLPHGLNLIAGQRADADRAGTSLDPATGQPIGTFADASRADGARAIAAARAAFGTSPWSRDRALRARVLNEFADRIEEHRAELTDLIALENGKIRPEAAFEVGLTPGKLRYAAALALTDTGRAAETAPGSYSRVLKEPIGVAGVIVPWNSPLFLAARSLGPALAAGCTVVLKMPAQTALVADRLAGIAASLAGLPPGVLNVVVEAGSEVAELLVASPDVDAVSFTGSTPTGRAIMAAGAATVKRLVLELGGKTPVVVLDDADLDAAVPVIIAGVTVFAGQFCMAGSRILAQRGIAADLRDRLAAGLEAVVAGPASDPASMMGPLIDRASAERVDRVVAEAAGYAKVLVRGGLVAGQPAGAALVRPSLLEVDRADRPVVQMEIFGPVATFEVFDADADAVALANATPFGLAAGVWTRDVDRAQRVAREIRAGTVWTNNWALVADQFEEGGYKSSGLGRLNGLRGLEEFQEFKHYVHQVPA